MNKWIATATMVAWCLPLSALAASPFDGTWRMDIENAKLPTKPVVISVMNGIYSCSTCVPPEQVKADGADQKIAGSPYVDTVAVTLTGDHAMRVVEKKAGKVVDDETRSLSADGKTMSFDETSTSLANGLVTTSKGSLTRVAAGPAGSAPMSGDWRITHISASGNARVMTYKLAGKALSFSMPTGESFTATIDGPEAPFKGDPGTDTVSIKRISATTLQETDKKDGKVVFIGKMSVPPGGRVMELTYTNMRNDRTVQMKAYKE
jgi:hypothetical protein